MTLELDVIENTPIEEIESNTRHNASTYHNWLQVADEHDWPAILVGGGDSINDHIEDIRELQNNGGAIFAMNAASQWCRKHDIPVDYQLILDAKDETASLVDLKANTRLIASQCHPDTTAAAGEFVLWHLNREGLEDWFPAEKVKAGGYAIVGGDSSVGVCGLCAAYVLGYRELHVFGYDTSYRDGKGHGYEQRINDRMPTIKTDWAGKEYTISIAMKDQCRHFLTYAEALKAEGCTFHVYGEGLLQDMYRTDPGAITERDKYRMMWMYPEYREISPGEHIAEFYVKQFKPEGEVIDFGCGTGKGSVKLHELGLTPILIDFADNCRDEAAQDFPFLEWDLTDPIPTKAKHGFCTDVMEHIPTDSVDTVIKNIMDCSESVFFMISTVHDQHGGKIGAILHNTVRPHAWWVNKFASLGYTVLFHQDAEIASLIYAKR